MGESENNNNEHIFIFFSVEARKNDAWQYICKVEN